MSFRTLSWTLFFLLFFQSFASTAQTVHPNYLDGVLYARQDTGSTLQLDPYLGGSVYLDSLINEHGIDSIGATLNNAPRWHRVEFQDSSGVGQLIQALEASSIFDTAEKMPYFETSYDPNDPLYSQQWHLEKVDAPSAWDTTKGDSSITIAVVDNAVSTQHEDLVGALWVNEDESDGNGFDDDLNGYVDDRHGYDVADGNGDPNPPSGSGSSSQWIHGTHVGGIAGASTDNGTGGSSLGFRTRIIAVKCSPDNSSGGALTNAYEGVDYAIEAGADIINMSFGSYSGNMVGDVLLQNAKNDGIALIGAAGNDDSTGVHYPAGHSDVIAVGATDANDKKASFSNYGSWLDLMAPGVQIESSVSGGNSDQYSSLNGTSMAAPVVSGVAALVLSVKDAGPEELEQHLEEGSVDIGQENPNYEGRLGSGRVSALSAVQNALGVEEVESSERLKLYPRPSTGTVTLEGIPDGVTEYRVIGPNGKLFEKGPLEGRSERFSFDLPTGVYILQLRGEDRSHSLKLAIVDSE